MARPGQHVVPSGDGWAVRKAGSSRVTGTFETQSEAISKAREIAKAQKVELYIHGRNGKIRQRNSFGDDRHPPKE